ncbi:serine/threonine-protein kinase 11-interacting protein isoform X2 [Neodiprion fabricii]|uniref:serine/threonine-protein kinase 11-interacting protein isoform X2 n=1 Tax=Neodiprion fabricii TaxID=2872261 RepID=UPI001ED91A7E|nr:serine/threonine-protein kinase 11-interacting protein isoform X2 [Neodiprion fabricii]
MSAVSYNPRDMPGRQEIIELARLLRQNGDKILSATSKLSLSTSLLNNLNEAFTLIVDENEDLESSFRVCNSSKIDIFRDLKFLHDIVQKTISLKITHRPSDCKTNVDITKFRHLKYLELQKVCIESVRGLQGVRGQLENVVCAGGRGVGSVGRLLAACGGDASADFVWGSLKSLILPYNALARIDKSLELAPWLQTLDLSHNLISSAKEIDCLPNLRKINLGYNKLESVPEFSKPVFHSLQVLVLKNNYIENISGLKGLESLSELDLSYNCLTDHSVLWPLENMSALLWVSLEGNPLAFHERHRIFSIKHLHPSLAYSKFILDQVPLSKAEKQIVSENRLFSIRSTRSVSGDDLASLSNSIRSDVTSTSFETMIFNESLTQSQCSDVTKHERPKSRKKRNITDAVITDIDHSKQDGKLDSSLISNIEASTEHLDVKKQVEALREKYGENDWLHEQAGTFVQDIMGLERSSGPLLSYKPAQTSANTPVDVPINDSPSKKLDNSSAATELTAEPLIEAKFKQIDEDDNESIGVENEKDEETLDSNNLLVNEIVSVSTVTHSQPEPAYDGDEEKGDLYVVQKKKTTDETERLFLVVTPDDIKEKDEMTGRVKCRWATNMVLSCVMGRGDVTTVDIIFDTTKRDRQYRTYFMEPNDAKQLVATVSEIINGQQIALKVYKCIKCSTHFSQDVDRTALASVFISDLKGPKCPTCGSSFVIEEDELLTPEVDKRAAVRGKDFNELLPEHLLEPRSDVGLQHSESHSSIGSATSLDDSRESTPSVGTVTKKYESDIEILSNPSQSSIEVLDENSISSSTPIRKRSSEERRIAVVPSLLTIPDVNILPAGLTESSSSGSLTDSVCTTYENKRLKPAESNTKLITNALSGNGTDTTVDQKDATPQPVTNLSSILGGLLSSMKIGPSKLSSPISETDPAFVGSSIQYSYTNYSSIDHRVKLHIILHVFEHPQEDLVLLLKADILTKDMSRTIPGCLILSTSKVYLLKIIGPEGEDPQKWLQKECSWTMDRLRTFAPLPFKQGILVDFYQPGTLEEASSNTTLVCILQDFQRTSNFLSYLTDLLLPDSCEVKYSVPQHCTSRLNDLLKFSKSHQDGDALRLLALFSRCTIKYENQNTIIKVAGLLVTMSTLLVMEDNMQWLIPQSSEKPVIVAEQAMSNLIEVEHNGTSLTLSYLDEVAGTEETWIIEFVSSGAVETVINSIQPPWEDLFSVPLQVTHRTPLNTPKT